MDEGGGRCDVIRGNTPVFALRDNENLGKPHSGEPIFWPRLEIGISRFQVRNMTERTCSMR
jgi:hypothetical protein